MGDSQNSSDCGCEPLPGGSSDRVVISRDALHELNAQFELLAQIVLGEAKLTVADFEKEFGPLGQSRYCCHYGCSFQNCECCSTTRAYSMTHAKSKCIASYNDYMYTSKGSCSDNSSCDLKDEEVLDALAPQVANVKSKRATKKAPKT